ncbi:GlxA family transcriptional regulator [Roseomonas sp. M0104]|uniref:GlxA family transcriptional regulator n=1 Tax=Teichococcus coralli TaxID=2545983 RepID=A0A845BGD7_9PROT|nr:GlxA family transcriptional regulator [Pseudoroseomonas coralli]MXP62549.1 GlxA family transcriptional regulator [Pseudoroseomonas coralli]
MKDIMPSFPAKPRSVVLPLYPGVMLLDVAGPAEVFAAAARLAGQGAPVPYRLHLVSPQGGAVATELGVGLDSMPWASLGEAPADTLLVPGGEGALAAAEDAAFLDWLRSMAGAARRVASVCLGSFILAAAGLLEGRAATTHWRHCAALQRRHPGVMVRPEPIFVRDGRFWTSAGVTAGIDMALALVEEDLGHAAALEVAQRLVVFLKRPGGQAQFSAALAAQASSRDSDFAGLLGWMAANLSADLRVEVLAERAGMAPRSFARAFVAQTGETPAHAVEGLRVEAARHLLETGELAVAEIARRCGFGDDERMRRAFLRRLEASPAEYRARFGRAVA